jgi:hypothetical protein
MDRSAVQRGCISGKRVGERAFLVNDRARSPAVQGMFAGGSLAVASAGRAFGRGSLLDRAPRALLDQAVGFSLEKRLRAVSKARCRRLTKGNSEEIPWLILSIKKRKPTRWS